MFGESHYGMTFGDTLYESASFPDPQLAPADLLNAAAILMASGNYTAEAAVTKALELDALIKKGLNEAV
jgi:hypothetical protein